MDESFRSQRSLSCESSAAADALAAMASVTAGKPLPSNDAWVPSFENRRDSANSLRMQQENTNW